MNVLSLFDGISCGQIALNRAGIHYDNYFASEVDKHAIKVTQHNYPNTIQLGDVRNVKASDLPKIDLLIGGSPCQGFSFAGKQLNFDDPRSKLFFEYVRLKNEVNPTYFLLENVKMKKEYEDVISKNMICSPYEINSSLVSAQNRERLYWTNISFTMPKNKNIRLRDILLTDFEYKADVWGGKKGNQIKASTLTGAGGNSCGNHSQMDVVRIKEATVKGFCEVIPGESIDLTFPKSKTRRGRVMRIKSNYLTASPFDFFYYNGEYFRRYSPVECERLQTIPDDYTSIVSSSQRFRQLGNCWTVDVVSHIFKGLTKNPINKPFYHQVPLF